ncbi:hypothetical protein [Streptomyces sp. NPDC051001]|uniref:hypothetical protein n=1 Tax=Streptomyces sp. NPDC051001 TaxID=3155795 RepID=UPI003436A756
MGPRPLRAARALAETELGGLDGVVVCLVVAAFGPAPEISDAVAEHLTAVNSLAPWRSCAPPREARCGRNNGAEA